SDNRSDSETAGTPGNKSPAGPGAASVSVPEVKTPTAPQNKALQNVKGEHPSGFQYKTGHSAAGR
ncbi:hypothetical protein L9F63_015770, partial [Diploptera punctata]